MARIAPLGVVESYCSVAASDIRQTGEHNCTKEILFEFQSGLERNFVSER